MANAYGGGTSGLPTLNNNQVKSPASATPAAATTTPSVGGVYWVGADNNVYAKGPGGNGTAVTNFGKAGAYNGKGIDAALGSVQGTRIADPNAPTPKAPTNPTGGSSGSTYQDNSNDIALNNAALASSDSQTQGGIDKINSALATLYGNYDTEAATNATSHTNSSNDNQNQLQIGKQTALSNAASGRQGLIGTLSGIGALSGDSLAKANAAVQAGANEDLTGASNTFSTNQSGVDNAYKAFTDADAARRKQAQIESNNSILNARNSGLNTKQSIYVNLAKDFAGQGDAARAKSYTDQAASLYPEIAATNVPNSTITPQAAAYTPATLASYLNKSNTTVGTTGPTSNDPSNINSIPGLSATNKKQLVFA